MERLPMKNALVIPLIAISACAQSAPPSPSARPCDLTVSFGSYAMGIDRPALAAVRAILADRVVRSIEERHQGREGELVLCARTRRPADAERLFHRIRSALPTAPRGPIRVHSASGLRFDAPPQRR
ncbi:MAG TPA: hypothetical protein VFZ91_11010 [Allosphingosinicella sp.]